MIYSLLSSFCQMLNSAAILLGWLWGEKLSAPVFNLQVLEIPAAQKVRHGPEKMIITGRKVWWIGRMWPYFDSIKICNFLLHQTRSVCRCIIVLEECPLSVDQHRIANSQNIVQPLKLCLVKFCVHSYTIWKKFEE